MCGLLALIKTTRDMWTDITQASEQVKIQKLIKEKVVVLHIQVSHKISTHLDYNLIIIIIIVNMLLCVCIIIYMLKNIFIYLNLYKIVYNYCL